MNLNNGTVTFDTGSNKTMTTTHSSNINITRSNINLNTTHQGNDLFVNGTVTESLTPWMHQADSYGLGTTVTIAIVLGSVAFVIIVVIVVVCFVRKKIKKKKTRAWVDNLTLSYIADSNIDLTKDNYDEMVSLDNDNFLNSLVDAQSFSVYSTSNNTRQYTYSYF